MAASAAVGTPPAHFRTLYFDHLDIKPSVSAVGLAGAYLPVHLVIVRKERLAAAIIRDNIMLHG
jgi:hypothetical protein